MIDTCNSPAVSTEQRNEEFLEMLPELQSRATILSRRYRDKEAAASDALAFMYLNFTSARRRGKKLNGPALGWAAALFLSFRSLAVRPREVDCSVAHVSTDADNQDHPLAERIAEALTTDEWADPGLRAQQRIDWAALADRLPDRMQKILHALSIGASKSEIAKSLGISRSRVSQILDQIAVEITAFFEPERAAEGRMSSI